VRARNEDADAIERNLGETLRNIKRVIEG